ncbi:MAG: hypothetical protein M3R59_01015 [Verrucomicrobiota bacterium]|nr:hypothetical protein [Verrucomicrobiota bacterium]
MPLPIAMPKSAPIDPLLTVTRTAVGLGLGLLVADRIRRPARQATAIALVSIGTLAALPYLLKITTGLFDRSDLGSRSRLRSIRGDSGYSTDEEVY